MTPPPPQISNLGSDLTFCNLSVLPLHREERQKLNMMQKTGLDTLIRSACIFCV